MVNFMPFFLPAFSMKELTSDADESTAIEEGLVENEVLESPRTSEVEDRLFVEDVAGQGLTDVVVERNGKLDATNAGQGDGAVLQPCAA